MSKEERKEEKANASELDVVNWEEIAMALAKDLVEMSRSVRNVLANSTFNYNIIDEVKLLEATTASVLETYVATEENSEKEELEESN